MRVGSLFSGCGGLDIGISHAIETITGQPTNLRWMSEFNPAASLVLAHRYPTVPNLGDITKIDWHEVEPVDILSGGYPCQPFSTAGQRQGTDDDRHLWPFVRDALRILRPSFGVFENVRGHLSLGFDEVLADLAGIGFDAEWGVFRSADVGAPHRRERLFILACNTDSPRRETVAGRTEPSGRAVARRDTPADTASPRPQRRVARDRRPEPEHGQGGSDPVDHFGARDGSAADTQGGDGRLPQRQGICEEQCAVHEPRERAGRHQAGLQDWGRFTDAIRRWESTLGRMAPAPILDRRHINAEFPEWMMGLPAGWVTAVPGVSRRQALKIVGNAVQPQTAAAGVGELLHRYGWPHEQSSDSGSERAAG